MKILILAIFFSCSNSSQSLSSINNRKNPINIQKDLNPTIEFNKKFSELEDTYQIELSLPVFEKSTEEIKETQTNTLENIKSRIQKLLSINIEKKNFKNTIFELQDILQEVQDVRNRIDLITRVTDNENIREVGIKTKTKLDEWKLDTISREDIFKAYQLALRNIHATNEYESLEKVDHRIIDFLNRDFTDSGFGKTAEVKSKINLLFKEIAQLKEKIYSNDNLANNKKVSFFLDELIGLNQHHLKQLTFHNGQYQVRPGISNEYSTIVANADLEATRKRIFQARVSLSKNENQQLMHQTVLKRAKLAKLLGYEHWADYRTSMQMTGSQKVALNFVNDLIDKLGTKFHKETNTLTDIKQGSVNNLSAQLQAWDVNYFTKKLKDERYNLNLDHLSEYFEYYNTLESMFEIYERIFKIKINKIKAPYLWDKEVELIELIDTTTQKPLGFVYLDMFPRPETGKSNHFSMARIKNGKLLANGRYQRPVVALICNFQAPKQGSPGLLSFGRVQTLFHEFGHALHSVLTEVKYGRISGVNVPIDFTEAPSQVLEYWVEDKQILKKIAKHYKDPSKTIDYSILNKMKEANSATVATHYRRQMAYSLMDLKIYSLKDGESIDIYQQSNDVLKEVYFDYGSDTAALATFLHPFGGYHAGYYGYAWSDSLSADMATEFKNSPDGFLDIETGLRLRKEIYEKGNESPSMELIENFLGRKPSNVAFLKLLGI